MSVCVDAHSSCISLHEVATLMSIACTCGHLVTCKLCSDGQRHASALVFVYGSSGRTVLTAALWLVSPLNAVDHSL